MECLNQKHVLYLSYNNTSLVIFSLWYLYQSMFHKTFLLPTSITMVYTKIVNIFMVSEKNSTLSPDKQSHKLRLKICHQYSTNTNVWFLSTVRKSCHFSCYYRIPIVFVSKFEIDISEISWKPIKPEFQFFK